MDTFTKVDCWCSECKVPGGCYILVSSYCSDFWVLTGTVFVCTCWENDMPVWRRLLLRDSVKISLIESVSTYSYTGSLGYFAWAVKLTIDISSGSVSGLSLILWQQLVVAMKSTKPEGSFHWVSLTSFLNSLATSRCSSSNKVLEKADQDSLLSHIYAVMSQILGQN